MGKTITAALICAFAITAGATQYSKLSLITAAKQAGRWDAIKAFIERSGYAEEWAACSYLSDAYPQFAAITNAVVQAGLGTAEEVNALLAASVDTALPDSLVVPMYHREMSNEAGRVRWHGKVARTHFDTNALVKTTWYADGWEFRENFERKVPPSVQSQLSAAEKKALAERRKREAEERKLAKKNARIAMLTTNLTAEVSALMARKRWPEELARLYLLQELNELRGPVEVNQIVTPQN